MTREYLYRILIGVLAVALALVIVLLPNPKPVEAGSMNDAVCAMNSSGLKLFLSDGKIFSFDLVVSRCMLDGGGFGFLCRAVFWDPRSVTNLYVSNLQPYSIYNTNCPQTPWP